MTLGTEIGETSYNMLTIYPIQSNHCGKGLMMRNTCIVASQQDSIGFFEKRSSYVHPKLWVSGTFKRSLNWRNCGTLPPEIPLAIATGHGYLLGDLLFNDNSIQYYIQLNLQIFTLPFSYRITISHCLEDLCPFHYARSGYPLSLPIGGATATKGHDSYNREM